jgi:hypothetical protein
LSPLILGADLNFAVGFSCGDYVVFKSLLRLALAAAGFAGDFDVHRAGVAGFDLDGTAVHVNDQLSAGRDLEGLGDLVFDFSTRDGADRCDECCGQECCFETDK